MQKWRYAKVNLDIDSQLFESVSRQAYLKAQNTRNESQAGIIRPPELKYQRQFMGSLAEAYSKLYLEAYFEHEKLDKDWSVIRYDDGRTDNFRTPSGEYDIK